MTTPPSSMRLLRPFWSGASARVIEELYGSFAVLETVCDNSESQGLHTPNNVISIAAVAPHAWQRGHLRDPATVFFAFELDREGTVGFLGKTW
jgi:hypothetical protein